MYTDEIYEELSRQSLVGQAIAINDTGRGYFHASAVAERAATARRKFSDTHGTNGRVPLQKIVAYITFAGGLLCIYGIDILLFGASAEYVASLLGSGSELWAKLAKFIVPACFLGIEVLIAFKIEEARHAERFAFGSRVAKKLWFALGILVALVMPLAAKATAESAGVVAESDAPVLMIAVLGIICFAAHVLVLFGGNVAHEAKTYLTFTLACGYHSARDAATSRKVALTLASFNSMFIAYVHAWRAHNSHYTAVPSGPFDVDVVQLLKRQFPQVTNGVGGKLDGPEE